MTKNATHIPIYGFFSRETRASHMTFSYNESGRNYVVQTQPGLAHTKPELEVSHG